MASVKEGNPSPSKPPALPTSVSLPVPVETPAPEVRPDPRANPSDPCDSPPEPAVKLTPAETPPDGTPDQAVNPDPVEIPVPLAIPTPAENPGPVVSPGLEGLSNVYPCGAPLPKVRSTARNTCNLR